MTLIEARLEPLIDADPCPECTLGFTQKEWDDRCSEGLPDVHVHCCVQCTPTKVERS
jgi:hypothetical protein